MNLDERARKVVNECVPAEARGVDRQALVDGIRYAMVQAQTDVLQPPELRPGAAPLIVETVVRFVDHYLRRLRSAAYFDQANALRECRVRVLALHGIPAKPAASETAPRKRARA